LNIQEENGRIRLQLYDFQRAKMLFDFTVEKEAFNELKKHIIEHLTEYKLRN
jgi:hypothetical protein